MAGQLAAAAGSHPGEGLLREPEELLARNDVDGALRLLDRMKASGRQPGVDYVRGISFLRKGDVLHARQALLEELRWFPGNGEAIDLVAHVEEKVEKFFELPEPVKVQFPLFSVVLGGVRQHTMLHWPRLLSLFLHAKQVCEENIAGDFVECGVAGGGSAVILGVALQHYSTVPRKLYLCDTFEGMPPPTKADIQRSDSKLLASDSHWGTGTCSAPATAVQRLLAKFSLAETCELVPGLFQDSLPKFAGRTFSLLHFDADWHESTKCCLENLLPLLTQGGYCQVDDYEYWGGCRTAVDDFFVAHPTLKPARAETIDGNAVCFRR